MPGFLDKKNLEKRRREMRLIDSDKVKKELDKRYNECDNSGHKMIIDNQCPCCYRHITYELSEPLKSELEQRQRENKKLHPLDVPMDAPYWMEKTNRDIESQKHQDYQTGLSAIAKEFYPEEFN